MADEEDEYGKHFGKLDIDRVGFFDNTPPGPFDLYKTKNTIGEVREGLDKVRRMSCRRIGGLFDADLKRIFVGEVLPELCKQPKKPKKKLGIIHPTGVPKLQSTPGDWSGCIGKQPSAFSPELKQSAIHEPGTREKVPPNCMTNPTPRGGPGYLNITINPYLRMYDGYEPYEEEILREVKEDNKKPRRFVTVCYPEPYFDDNPYSPFPLPPEPVTLPQRTKRKKYFYLVFPKAPKGKNSGCFHKFPSYSSDPYDKPKRKPKTKVELPQLSASTPASRSKFTVSIIDRVTNMSLNANNFAQYREQVYPLK